MHAMNKESPSIKVLKGKGMDAEKIDDFLYRLFIRLYFNEIAGKINFSFSQAS